MNGIDHEDRVERKDRTEGEDRTERKDHTDRKDRADRKVPADRTREPIYAELVGEWRAQGRTVPAEPDALWAALTGFTLRARPEPEGP
ncbi:hypothetical protein [Streptomyces sp. NPDC002520]